MQEVSQRQKKEQNKEQNKNSLVDREISQNLIPLEGTKGLSPRTSGQLEAVFNNHPELSNTSTFESFLKGHVLETTAKGELKVVTPDLALYLSQERNSPKYNCVRVETGSGGESRDISMKTFQKYVNLINPSMMEMIGTVEQPGQLEVMIYLNEHYGIGFSTFLEVAHDHRDIFDNHDPVEEIVESLNLKHLTPVYIKKTSGRNTKKLREWGSEASRIGDDTFADPDKKGENNWE